MDPQYSEAVVGWLNTRKDWVIMSVDRADRGDFENVVKRCEFENTLEAFASRGIVFNKAEGNYNGTPEVSYIVFGVQPHEALYWATLYEQESVLLPIGLVWTDMTQIVPAGGPFKAGRYRNYYTRLPDGTRVRLPLKWTRQMVRPQSA
jgi:hypothetical protein